VHAVYPDGLEEITKTSNSGRCRWDPTNILLRIEVTVRRTHDQTIALHSSGNFVSPRSTTYFPRPQAIRAELAKVTKATLTADGPMVSGLTRP